MLNTRMRSGGHVTRRAGRQAGRQAGGQAGGQTMDVSVHIPWEQVAPVVLVLAHSPDAAADSACCYCDCQPP